MQKHRHTPSSTPLQPTMEKKQWGTMMEEKDIERALEPLDDTTTKKTTSSNGYLFVWITINVVATVAIVYVNKSIFDDPSFKRCPSSFVAFHFTITALMLHIASRPQVALFTPARTSTVSVLPLTIIMCVNVVLVNLSLSYSSIVCYQIVRILLTPLTAAINFCFYGSRIPFLASFALIPACIGVGIVSYYDSLPPSKHATVKAISVLGVSFALSGVTSSSIYTVWVSQYHKKLKMSSMQLLYNQVPLGAMILAFVSLFTDTFPVWSNVLPRQWMMLVLSGLCACLVNLSQFLIINDAGPVSSTVVGHLKTCLIVGLGWATSKKAVGNESILGILLAILGVILYSVAMYKEQSKASR